MRNIFVIFATLAYGAFAGQWIDYAEFEKDATNALDHVDILMSDEYVARLISCKNELSSTNEIATAALLLLAISDDAKSNHMEDFIGSTSSLSRISSFVTNMVTERTLWQKSCAIVMLATGNDDPAVAQKYFICATNAVSQWDEMSNCFDGGDLYRCIARYYGAPEMDARSSVVFAAADSAKTAGYIESFKFYLNMLSQESREFLSQ